MSNVTYEQFIAQCGHWNYTTDAGFRAMCFASNILGQYCGNCRNYLKEISNSEKHSDVFKKLAETKNEDAIRLLFLYNELHNDIFKMLEEHEKIEHETEV